MNIAFKMPKIPVSWGVIAVLLIIIFLQRECSRCPKCPEQKVTHDTIKVPGDKIPVLVTHYVPVPDTIYKDTGSTKWIPSKIDSLAVVLDYYSKPFYRDSIWYIDSKGDTSCLVILKEILFKNKIFDREVYVQNIRPQIIERTIITPAAKLKNKFFVGGSIGASPQTTDHSPQININALWQTKKDHIYYYSYGVLDKSHNLGTYWKIKISRK